MNQQIDECEWKTIVRIVQIVKPKNHLGFCIVNVNDTTWYKMNVFETKMSVYHIKND